VLQPDSPVPGDVVTARVEAVDPDGDELHLVHRWQVGGQRFEGESDTLVLPSGTKEAIIQVEVTAHDGELESAPRRASTRVPNRPPVITSLVMDPEAEITVEGELVASMRAEDADGDPVELVYTWYVNGDPIVAGGQTLPGASLERGDRVELEVVASDGDDESEPLRSAPVRVVNSAPRITSTPSQVDEGGSFVYQVQVEDPDQDRLLRFRLTRAPAGMQIDWLKGRVSWKPGQEQAGRHPVEIEVDDQAGGLATQEFELEVALDAEDPSPPTPAAPAP
jgi:hypothetical protein